MAEIVGLKARHAAADVAGRDSLGRVIAAADQPAREHPVGGDRDPELAAGGQDRPLDAARDQRVLDLEVDDRVHGGRAADRVGADLREADVAHVAGLHQLRDRADGLLDRDVRVEPRRPVHVDVVRAQPLERVRHRGLDRLRARVVAEPAPVRPALSAELHADQDVVAVATGERVGDQQLVVAHPVEVAGVEQRDAGVERGVDRRDALVAVGGAVRAPTCPCTRARAPRRRVRWRPAVWSGSLPSSRYRGSGGGRELPA